MIINIEDVKFVHFSGGEVHLNGKDFFPTKREIDDIVWAPIHDSVDLMELLIYTDAYKRYFGVVPRVCIPYVPYARQDRVANPGESLTIKVFADIINSQHYPEVWVMDPHSEVCMALLDNARVMETVDDTYLRKVVDNYDECVVLAPDAGAHKRLCKVIKDVPLIYATKQRDTKTGALSNVELHVGGVDILGKRLLVVDDICDGGGTFLLLKNELVKAGIANPLELYVTHGIFSKGTDIIKEAYTKIYTTNSFYQGSSDGALKVYDLKEDVKVKQDLAKDIYRAIKGVLMDV